MTTLVRWNTGRWAPVREVAVMQNELSRLMNGLFEGTGRPTQSWVPTLDAWETESELVYAFDLPGIPQDKISVEVEDGTLTVSAERTRSTEVNEGAYHRSERRYGSFSRSFSLPQTVDPNRVSAEYKHGVLTVKLPLREEAKPRSIKVDVAA